MNKVILGVMATILVAIGVYSYLKVDNVTVSRTDDNVPTYSSKDLGLSFDYPVGPQGYVLEESEYADPTAGPLNSLVLMRTQDTLNDMPEGGEGPATITIMVFKNPNKLSARAWADQYQQYSNINLKIGDVSDDTIGGVSAIKYEASGLYNSKNTVVAHGENIYVFSGMYLDKDSDLYRDFPSVVESVRFNSASGE